MSSYGPHKDTPNKIQREGNQISVELIVNGSTGEIRWSIPPNINSDHLPPEEYDGILLLLDTKPIEIDPIDNKFYQADNTASRHRHVGDVIGTALVVGAIYNDKSTTSIKITDLLPETNYYVAAYAADNVRRYHSGVFSYSLPYESKNLSLDTAGYHTVKLGVLPTDLPRLLNNSTIKYNLDGTDHTITVTPASTYADLVAQLNLAFAQLDSPFIGVVAPHTNSYVIIDEQLTRWTGRQYVDEECYFGDTSPDTVPDGTYWLSEGVLYERSQGVWLAVPLYSFFNSIDNLQCGDVWYDPDVNLAYEWQGYNWVSHTTYNTIDDPSMCATSTCKKIWFDGTDYYRYNKKWNKLKVYSSSVDPTTYYNGYYWYHNKKIDQLINGVWTNVGVTISETEPVDLTVTWYKPSDNQFRQSANSIWSVVAANIINTPYDVRVPVTNGYYWFDGTDLHTWDETNFAWVVITDVVSSATDPNLSSVKTNDFWINGTDLKQWDGSQWVDIPSYLTNVGQPSLFIGLNWFNGISYSQWDGTSWNPITVLTLISNFATPSIGQFWYDTSTNSFSMWNGASWVPLMYYTSSVEPAVDTHWYHAPDMKSWDGSKWVVVNPKASVELKDGNLIFTSATLGSKSKFFIYDYDDNGNPNTFNYTSPMGQFEKSVVGTDHVSTVPLYKQVGVGTDGSQDERRAMANNLLMYLGYPSVQVELDKAQVDLCLDLSLIHI